MLNRRQFGTYLGLTLLGLATGGLALLREKPFVQRFMEGIRVSHVDLLESELVRYYREQIRLLAMQPNSRLVQG